MKAGGGGAGEAALRAPTLRAAQAGEGNQVEPAELNWHAHITGAGEHRGRRFRPQDLCAQELQKAWKQAVAWCTQNEKESRKWKQ